MRKPAGEITDSLTTDSLTLLKIFHKIRLPLKQGGGNYASVSIAERILLEKRVYNAEAYTNY
jgi:hypothetical protein